MKTIREIEATINLFNGTFENGELVITSRDIAELTGKEHRNVLRDVREEIDAISAGGLDEYLYDDQGRLIFEQSSSSNKQGKQLVIYKMRKEGVQQILSRYSAPIRRLIIKRLSILENIAKFGGREISYDDLNSKHSVLKPLLYHFSEVVNTATEIAKQPIPEDIEYLEDLSKRMKKIVHDEDMFEEWWESLIQHQNDTGITDRVINRPNKEEM